MPDDPVATALAEHSAQVDTAVERFLHDLERTLSVASIRLQHRLLKALKLDADGKIAATVANQRTLRRLPLLWQEALDAAGFEAVLHHYLATFPAQIPAFYEVLQALNSRAKNPLPLPKFSQSDLEYFTALKLSAGSDVAAAIEGAAQNVFTRTIFAAGGVRFSQLAETLEKQAAASQARAETLADTSLMSFYRTISERGFERVQASMPKTLLRYIYRGPRDSRNRPFCAHLLDQHRSWTRAEIDQMDSGQGKGTVFFVAGSWRCRHSFVVSLEPLAGRTEV